MRTQRTEVLVVGAGPVGLYTAISLADAGIEVTIIDSEVRTTARSYACALHSQTLSLLQRLGLADAVLTQGRKLETIAIYDGESCRAELHLSKLGGDFPFLVVLPQNVFESLLEQRLAKAGVKVQWNHRFEELTEEDDSVALTIEELSGTSIGYIVPHWETVVQNRNTVRARFVLGADGQNSLVRHKLGIESQRVDGLDFFAAFEFEPVQPIADEVRVVLDQASTNVLWPLPGNKCRWTFQMNRPQAESEFPEKERRAVRVVQPVIDERIRQYVQKVARQRAPWFTAGINDVSWCTEVCFEHRLVSQFGRNRCWLVGDAAHQTGPVGVQSMNVGFLEADALATAFEQILRQQAPGTTLAAFDSEYRQRWRRLLGLTGGLNPGPLASAWVRDHAARLLPCLPASGPDLSRLAAQLHLEFREV